MASAPEPAWVAAPPLADNSLADNNSAVSWSHVQFLTDFADQQVMLPLGFVLAVMLALSGWKRGALVWMVGVSGTLACLAVLKIVFLACGWLWPTGELDSPAGPAASAALFYGGFPLRVRRPDGAARYPRLLSPFLVAGVIGASRIVLHYHRPAEVLLGSAIGVAGAFLLPLLAGPPPPLPFRRMLLPVALVLALMHGSRLQAETLLRHFSIDGLWPPDSCRMPDDHAWRAPPAVKRLTTAA